LKTTEIKQMIEDLSVYIDTIVQSLKSIDYNAFVDQANQMIADYTASVNTLVRTLELPQKLEATREFVNLIFSSLKSVFDQLREIKVAEMINTVKEIVDQTILNDLKAFVENLKVTEIDVKAAIAPYLEMASTYYTKLVTVITDIFTNVVEVIQKIVPEQKFIEEIKQILEGLITGLKTAELDIPSFTFPLTDLVIPSMKISMASLQELEIPTQLDIPEFTILGFHTVPAVTISFDDIKQKIVELIDFIVNFEIKMLDMETFFGDLTLNYLPPMPEITFPEFALSDISFPAMPQVPVEKLVETLQIPDFKLPTIPTEIMIPSFGKLYGEIKFISPFYTIKTNVEFQNSTENEMTPQFTGFLTSRTTAPQWSPFEIITYNLDATARVAVPKMNRVVFAETLKFNNPALGVEHQASLTFYGQAAQAQAKTTVKVITEPYTADIVNIAFFAIGGGMTSSLETTYNHRVDIPIFRFTSDATLSQKAVVRQDGLLFTITADNIGNAKLTMAEANHEANHKSNLQFTLNPNEAKLTFTGDTDSGILNMKQQITAESALFSYVKFNARCDSEGPEIKNSVIVASGQANLYDMKLELKVNHDTELVGTVNGDLSNVVNIVIVPTEVVFDFQNKGNTRMNVFESLTAKIDLQNDYSVIIKPDTQQFTTVALARLNQYKVSYNFKVDNNMNEAGIFVAVDGEANLDFLNSPISIPEFTLPFVDFRTPAISDLNLYETFRLEQILTTPEQNFDVDAKVVYQKNKGAPLVDVMGLVQIPSLGNLITELSFKSAIINLNLNAGLYNEDDIVLRLGATTASVFESLKTKLDATTSLTTRRGIKMANSLSLENPHIEGTHDSTISLSTETLDAALSVATIAKISLPILNLEANQNLVADTKTKANAVSTLKLKGNFNVPIIVLVGVVEAEHNLKVEGTFEYASMETTAKANIEGTLLEHALLGILDNEATLYFNVDGLRTTSKITADAKLTNGETKVLGMDVNENLAVEASLSRVYAVLKFASNNEANVMNFNTKGSHVVQATIDLAPMSSLTADIEINMSQPSDLGDLSLFDKAVVELTVPKQKISVNAKLVTPVYTNSMVVEVEGEFPVYKIILKSSATSAIVSLEYDLDASSTADFGNDALNTISKAVLTHTDLTLDINHIISQALRRKRQADDSISRHTLNVDIISPTFTDVNFRYAARRDGISASISTPSTGFLGLQFQARAPSQMNARLYSRYISAPEEDVDILVIRASAKDTDKMNLQVAYNMEAPRDMLLGLKERLPSITSTLAMFADKYMITSLVEDLKSALMKVIDEVYSVPMYFDEPLGQLSILFRNTVVRYQKAVQVILDAAVKFLRETQFKLPGSDEVTTIPEVLKQLTTSISGMLEKALQFISESAEVYSNFIIDQISSVKISMPLGDATTVTQMYDDLRVTLKNIRDEVVDLVQKTESLDMMLEKLGETLKAIVEKTQELVDSLDSTYLDSMLINVNVLCSNVLTAIKNVLNEIPTLNVEQLQNAAEYVVDMFVAAMNQFNTTVSDFLQQASEEVQEYMKVSTGKVEINLPFPFQQ